MKSGTLIAVAVVGGGLLAVGYIQRLQRTKAELIIEPTASIYSLKLDGLTIRVDVLMKNPTSGSFAIRFPFISVKYNGKYIGSSKPVNQEIKLPAYGEAKFDKIMLKVPLDGVLNVITALVSNIKNKQRVALEIRTITEANFGWKKIPFEDVQTVTLTG